ncbi:hypothetical protein GCM10009559_68500 [Pseudonocardia zijingensis]|uniref:Uncharacterized protein n=1 Tax=Pseudonocardia zijingensis TaxID=153376 RepID=A0ABN1NC90_9PSEU
MGLPDLPQGVGALHGYGIGVEVLLDQRRALGPADPHLLGQVVVGTGGGRVAHGVKGSEPDRAEFARPPLEPPYRRGA